MALPATTRSASEAESLRITRRILEVVDREQTVSQRRIATELGIALGLANSYIKRCTRKGLLKVSRIPSRRYMYYLTPEGFSEKSRLTVAYFASSVEFFRLTKVDCSNLVITATRRNWQRVALVGATEVAEIMALCTIDSNIEIAAVIDPIKAGGRLLRWPVLADFDEIAGPVDGVFLTSIQDDALLREKATARFGPDRVLAPGHFAMTPTSPAPTDPIVTDRPPSDEGSA